MIDELNQALRRASTAEDLQQLATLLLKLPTEEARQLDAAAATAVYRRRVPERHLALLMLSLARGPQQLHAFADLLVEDPPPDFVHVGYAISPLLQRHDWLPSAIFPRLLDALEHPSVAGPVLDLANYLTRQGRVAQHPAAGREAQLISMLAAIAGGLARAEKDPRSVGDSVQAVQQRIAEAVGIVVSLCDALGLIGSTEALPKLNQTLLLAHRRVQTEAAGALAKLGDEHGKQHLLGLAKEPSARLRVLAYAEELGFSDEVEPQYTTAEARAEAELALWLSQPQNMAVPPSKLEVLDRRTLYWPGYDSPVDCLLWRFSYDFGGNEFSNVGITGPAIHAFAADMAELPIDDIYAAFAGWQAEHEDIFEVPEPAWNPAQTRRAESLVRYLEHEGCEAVRPRLLGIFLDEEGVAADVEKEGKTAVAATDGLETVLYVTENRLRPLTPVDAWNILKGRKMLRQFN